NRLFTLCVPTTIRSVTINPYFFDTNGASDRILQYQTSSLPAPEGHMIVDIDVFAGGLVHHFVQFESVELRPFAAPTRLDDTVLCTGWNCRLAKPDAAIAIVCDSRCERSAVLLAAERV